MKKLIVLFIFCAVVSAQNSTEVPTWEEIQKVLNYKENGTAAILYETRITSNVKDAEPVDDITSVQVDSSASIWMKFLLPKNVSEDRFTLVIKKGPLPVKTAPLKVSLQSNNGTLVYRTWRSHTFDKEGTFTVEIYFEESLVQTMTLEVVK
jgi:hypothetical protein